MPKQSSWLCVSFIFFYALPVFASNELDGRVINWQPGIPGGIPHYPGTGAGIVNVIDYGAIADDGSDDLEAFEAAIDACDNQGVVYIPAGTYHLSTTLNMFDFSGDKSLVLRGAGPASTKLIFTGDGDGIRIYGASNASVDIAIVDGASMGATQFQVSDVNGLSVGSYVVISMAAEPDYVNYVGYYSSGCTWCEGMGQIARIVAIDGLLVTLNRPLYFHYQDYQPQLKQMSWLHRNAYSGVEDLYLAFQAQESSGNLIHLGFGSHLWVKNVESDTTRNAHVRVRYCYGCEIRDSYFHHGFIFPGDWAYGIMMFAHNSDCLIENNAFYYLRHSMLFEGGGSGNVFGYNYSARLFGQEGADTNFLMSDIATHGAHPFMNLYESNIAAHIDLDNYWGSSSHNTFFRNHIERQSQGELNEVVLSLWAVEIQENNYYQNVIGNVLCTPGCSGAYQAVDMDSRNDSGAWCLGYHYGAATGVPVDSFVEDTLIRYGNFDYVTNQTHWESDPSEPLMPDSMYLTEKPDFFGCLPWPAIGSDLETLVGMLPAKARWDGNTDYVCDSNTDDSNTDDSNTDDSNTDDSNIDDSSTDDSNTDSSHPDDGKTDMPANNDDATIRGKGCGCDSFDNSYQIWVTIFFLWIFVGVPIKSKRIKK